jgi:hypothetical protein
MDISRLSSAVVERVDIESPIFLSDLPSVTSGKKQNGIERDEEEEVLTDQFLGFYNFHIKENSHVQ